MIYILYYFILVFLIFYFIDYYLKNKIEKFNNYNLNNEVISILKNDVNPILKNEVIWMNNNDVNLISKNEVNPISNNKIIWMYWETLPGRKKPGYIDLCINSVKFNCSKCFKIIVLDNLTIYDYLPNIKDMDLTNLELPQKVDYYRYELLEKYGGVWLDADILVLRCICPFYNKLESNDYVGFGCGYDLQTCSKKLDGYSKPLNWFMISKPNTDFIKCVRKKAYDKIIKSKNTKLSYHSIGKVILQDCYNELNKQNNWTYEHIPSKCQEFDTSGNKLNNIMIDFNWKDCEKERIFFPLYNTAPGYPDWFKELTEDELKNSNLYLKPLIEKAFEIKNICNF